MPNHTLFSPSPPLIAEQLLSAVKAHRPIYFCGWAKPLTQLGLTFIAAVFLVSVPVFIEAPLVRFMPWLSLLLTGVWLLLGFGLRKKPSTFIWGDLLIGFSWSWLAGSIYWGWFRWEPLLHLPIESMGLPFILWGLQRGWGMVGGYFYLGSLLGTAVTDGYFYLTGLIPYWRELMRAEPTMISPILQKALVEVETPWGISCAIVLTICLFALGLGCIQNRQTHWWTFSGAVLGTILVDSLFGITAAFA